MRQDHEEKILQTLGEKLRALRLERGLTQESLAHDAGFSRSYYNEIETGKRNISLLNLCRLASYLNVELVELVEEIPIKAEE